jgi:dTDP-glucose 4,6-dehydratase
MRLLVTGGAGFIGHHFCEHILRETSWNVVALDRTDSAGDWRRIEHIPAELARGRLQIVHRDLRAEIPERFDLGEPFDHIVHMAAASHVDRSIQDPLSFLEDNVMGTAHLFEWARRGHLRHGGKLLYFSTDEVFGPADVPSKQRFDEWSRFDPNNPYAASKAAAECLCTAWSNTFGLPILVTHCTNVYGPRQDREKFIPMAIEKITRGEEILIHADESATRSSSRYYIYVEDVCVAVRLLLDRGKVLPGQGKYNITSLVEYTNLDVAEQIAKLLGKPLHARLVSYVRGRPRHDMRYAISDAALFALGWGAKVSLEEGLRRVVDAR